MYLVKTPWLLKKLYPSLIWSEKVQDEKTIYLTFDDGPHPIATPFVLNTLQQYNAKATFFCIGKNVDEQPAIYHNIIHQDHAIGNHTYNHLNGYKTKDEEYIDNIIQAATVINSTLFRPPYGRITRFQARLVQEMNYSIIMWDVLSGDFDIHLSKEKCLENVLLNTKDGSIVVFHDSEKAFERLEYALPKMLEHFTQLGYSFKALH
ncbi:MAG: polysaccharide deacetylase family protein [Bacteroidetes bacterium]|nr:polysaccharide deacetylase family protein [Bacteroidota bacterium]